MNELRLIACVVSHVAFLASMGMYVIPFLAGIGVVIWGLTVGSDAWVIGLVCLGPYLLTMPICLFCGFGCRDSVVATSLISAGNLSCRAVTLLIMFACVSEMHHSEQIRQAGPARCDMTIFVVGFWTVVCWALLVVEVVIATGMFFVHAGIQLLQAGIQWWSLRDSE